MTITEVMAQLQRVHDELGYDAEVRFYADYQRNASDDQLDCEPVIVADYENEPSKCSVELYESAMSRRP